MLAGVDLDEGLDVPLHHDDAVDPENFVRELLAFGTIGYVA